MRETRLEKKKLLENILLIYTGELMKARVAFELEAGDGTGKDEMRIDDYKKLINKFGDIIKTELEKLK